MGPIHPNSGRNWGCQDHRQELLRVALSPVVDKRVPDARNEHSQLMKIDISQAALINGWMAPEELEWLAERAAKSEVIIEVGSWKGRSTKALAMHTPGVVYAVDNWQGVGAEMCEAEVARVGSDKLFEEFKFNLCQELRQGKVIPIRSDSATAAKILRDMLVGRSADMVFIDADHTYSSVRSDIETYLPLVREGGVISGHDYIPGWPGVVQAVDELIAPLGVSVHGMIWHSTVGRDTGRQNI